MKKVGPADQQIYNILLEMKEDMGEMKSDIKSTLAQAQKTNGRVTALEAWKEKVTNEKSYNAGRVAVISLLGGVITAVIISIVKSKLGL